jgi:small subunit ribosomal protein S20|tara:strand:+ start:157 stop:417 length:261 start_codon:yes stop_codon:yes gene_type:complete
MANTSQARKRARQNDKVRAHNTSLRTMLRTALKKIVKAIQAGDKKVAKEQYDKNISLIDRIADKKIIHKNKAARHKSRLNSAIKAL